MNEQEITIRWNDFEDSQFRANMQTGLDYFNCKNDITKPENGRYGNSLDLKKLDTQTPTKLSDRRIASNFFKFIINQQVAYGIARNFVLASSAIEELENNKNLFEMIKSRIFNFFKKRTVEDNKKRFEALNILVNKTFDENYGEFVASCTNAPKEQLGWLYIYYNEKGQLEFMNVNPLEHCPIWGNDKKTFVKGMIRKYKDVEYTDEGKKEIEYVEYYGDTQIDRYKVNDNVKDTTDNLIFIESKPYYIMSDGSWGKFPFIPFIPFKYNFDMTSLLNDIKSQIDAYDKVMSEVANNVIDLPNSEIFVKGFDGSNSDEVDKFVQNIKRTRILFGPEDSDAKSLAVPQNINQIDIHLTRLRKDIFEIGGGVDTQNKDLKDTSGVALRWSYSNLEEKFNIWATQLKISIKRIIDLIIWDNLSRGGEDLSDIDYDIIFDTDSIINESETIQNLQLSKGLISAETIAANHPYTKDATSEYEGMKRQMKLDAEMKLLAKGGTNDGTNDHNTNEGLTNKTI